MKYHYFQSDMDGAGHDFQKINLIERAQSSHPDIYWNLYSVENCVEVFIIINVLQALKSCDVPLSPCSVVLGKVAQQLHTITGRAHFARAATSSPSFCALSECFFCFVRGCNRFLSICFRQFVWLHHFAPSFDNCFSVFTTICHILVSSGVFFSRFQSIVNFFHSFFSFSLIYFDFGFLPMHKRRVAASMKVMIEGKYQKKTKAKLKDVKSEEWSTSFCFRANCNE